MINHLAFLFCYSLLKEDLERKQVWVLCNESNKSTSIHALSCNYDLRSVWIEQAESG
ncbi:hypothetical protein XCR1_1200047 [Xenorhabdus cabanillasii JM26]|uniref:Uncharacterized protein n=1 Tax=Xenorhabdus cabanillasii JM26 TaxID=1427517 RepID=W1IMG3_9GAMM|nr:hypothetical protein XCR1_1200047 [Xenorhabdus cabanillasii JM26]